MDANVIALPTAATAYVTVRKKGCFHAVQLVTPMPRTPLRTDLYSMTDKELAFDMARKTAAKMKRPFKIGGRVV